MKSEEQFQREMAEHLKNLNELTESIMKQADKEKRKYNLFIRSYRTLQVLATIFYVIFGVYVVGKIAVDLGIDPSVAPDQTLEIWGIGLVLHSAFTIGIFIGYLIWNYIMYGHITGK